MTFVFCVEDMRALNVREKRLGYQNETLNMVPLKEREAKTRQFSRAFTHSGDKMVRLPFFLLFSRRPTTTKT